MSKQRVDQYKDEIADAFYQLKRSNPAQFEKRLNISWSNWGFGLEDLDVSLDRLKRNRVDYVELHGNHYGPSLGYQVEDTKDLLKKFEMSVSGICGMFSDDNDLSSNRPLAQQEAISYIKREADFCKAVGGKYLLIVPGSVGRPESLDDFEFERSVRALQLAADSLALADVKGAIEPIRSAEVSLVHTVAEAKNYIKAVGCSGVQHINGDIYHMMSEEVYVPNAVIEAGEALVNLHLADSNRRAIGAGSFDFDTLIMALYLIGHNQPGRFVTPEPLGPGAGPYPARNGLADPEVLDRLVADSITYFREREDYIRSL